MKKSFVTVLLFLIIFLPSIYFAACKKDKVSPEYTIEYLKSLKTYSCKATYITKNGRDETKQICKQYYDSSEGYRLEIENKIVQIYKDDKIQVHDIKNDVNYTLDKEFDELYRLGFLGEFIRLMYSNEEAKTFCKNFEGKTYVVVELIVPGGNRNINKAVMYIDGNTYVPQILKIYDVRGSERVEVIYENFITGEELDKNLFK